MVNWQCICAIVLGLLGWGEDLTITRLAHGSSLKLALDKLLRKKYLPISLPVREFLSRSITHQDEQWVPRHDNIKRALHSTAARLPCSNHHNIRKIISEIHNILLSRNRYRTWRVFWWLKLDFWHWYSPLPPITGLFGPFGGDWQNIRKQLSPRLHPLTTAAAITHYGLLASTHNHWLIIDQEQMVVAILRIIVRSTSRCVCPTISETTYRPFGEDVRRSKRVRTPGGTESIEKLENE